MSSLYSCSPLKYLHHGSSQVWIALLPCLPLIVFVLEMTSVIFLATLIKIRLLKSSSMLLINFFDAASTLWCCYARFSFFFVFFIFLTEKADVDALPYSALESEQAGEALDALLSAFILGLKRSKKLCKNKRQNYGTFRGRLYRAFP